MDVLAQLHAVHPVMPNIVTENVFQYFVQGNVYRYHMVSKSELVCLFALTLSPQLSLQFVQCRRLIVYAHIQSGVIMTARHHSVVLPQFTNKEQ